MKEYIDNIQKLKKEQLEELLSSYDEELCTYAAAKARALTENIFGKRIYVRGLIEFTNICRNDCFYCGIRCSNRKVERFRMSREEILSCCDHGYGLGLRTFVLQGGEDPYFTDERLEILVKEIKDRYPECALTLSIGERNRDSYERLKAAGVDRYLLRHETADKEHYSRLHPEEMSLLTRMECLKTLKELGYQTGCGMMVGSPYQKAEHLAEDLIFMREFKPEMVGIGPFLPQKDTPFADRVEGNAGFTLFLISLIRLMLPDVLLPATTALGSAKKNGRIEGILAGANVIMPNISPVGNREKYLLYDEKASFQDDAELVLDRLGKELKRIGYEIDPGRGDYGEKK